MSNTEKEGIPQAIVFVRTPDGFSQKTATFGPYGERPLSELPFAVKRLPDLPIPTPVREPDPEINWDEVAQWIRDLRG